MTLTSNVALILAAWLTPGGALTESCNIQNASPPDRWKFIHAYDVATGELVFARPINGGESRSVTVSGSSIRIEYKFAGDLNYHSAIVTTCKGGNTVRI